MDLFANSDVFFKPDDAQSALAAYTKLMIDGKEAVDFCMVQKSGGNQPARLQIDATADGKLHVVGCSGGIGTYNMLFIDGVSIRKCNSYTSTSTASNESIMKKYLSLKDIKNRYAVVYIYPPTTGKASSAACGSFRGLINDMSAQLSEDDGGNLLLYVGLTITGSWCS